VVAHPVDRRGRPLDLVLVGGREGRRLAGEAQLEQIDPVAELDQALAELGGRCLSRLGHERFDGTHEATQGLDVAHAITHPCSIEQMFAGSEPNPAATCPAPDYHQRNTRAGHGER
jgi:hypothetical protein